MTVAHHRVAAGVRGSARGWNADQFGRQLSSPLVRPVVSSEAGGVERGGGGEPVVGALLGPERAGSSWGNPGGVVSSLQGLPVSHTAVSPEGVSRVWWGRVVGVWSYVENCTVDASIF